jgi:hypothetical protein
MPQDRYAHERGNPAVPQCGRSGVSILFDGRLVALRGQKIQYPWAAGSGKPDARGGFDYSGEVSMRMLRWITAGAAAVAATWVSVDLLQEAYGAGPPHYGRTANMDKWTSPWPVVLAVDGAALAVLIGAWGPWRRKRNKDQ